jgi:hypothetical protein
VKAEFGYSRASRMVEGAEPAADVGDLGAGPELAVDPVECGNPG